MNLPRKRIALLIETSTTWGRGIIRGIAQYARQEAHWSLTLETRGKHETPTLPFNWQGDGVIGRLISHQIVDSICKQAVPAINVSQIIIPDSPFPTVTTSETCVGEIAAAHLLERNFKSLGYYGPPHRQYYTDQILQAFSVEAELKKLPLSVFQPDRYLKTAQSSHDDLARLGPWLRKLKKPAGILAWNAVGAYRVISACELLEISVPKQIAVLAGENDELIESISEVSLSGIDHNPYEVGWHAAESLNHIFLGEPTRYSVRFIKPKGIRLGDSTARIAVSDTLVDQVIANVRNNPKRLLSRRSHAKPACHVEP